MSTISDALKKVQTQRDAGQPGPVPPPKASPTDGIGRTSGGPASGNSKAPWALTLLLALVLTGLLWSRWRMPAAEAPPPKTSGAPGSVSTEPPPPPPAPLALSEPVAPVAPADPTAPVPQAAASPPAPEQVPAPTGPAVPAPPARPLPVLPVLSATFYSEKNPVAIIDGVSLMQGEKAGDYEVARILPNSVILKRGDETCEIRLK